MINHTPPHATRTTRTTIDPLEPRRLFAAVWPVAAPTHAPTLPTDDPAAASTIDVPLFADPASATDSPPSPPDGPVLPGDANRDRTVDLTDFATLAAHFGQSDQSWQTGDFNGDGTVDLCDFTILASHFNKSV